MTDAVLNGPPGFGEDVMGKRWSRERRSAQDMISIALPASFRGKAILWRVFRSRERFLCFPPLKAGWLPAGRF